MSHFYGQTTVNEKGHLIQGNVQEYHQYNETHNHYTLANLAWKLYKSCKTAPESYYNISQELCSLHAVLQECDEVFLATAQPSKRTQRLKVITSNCMEVLEELDNIVTKFESLGAQDKRTWDRMRWHSNEIGEIRARITSHVGVLIAFMSTSQARVEQKLEELLREYRQGRMEGSVVSSLSVDSLTTSERTQWREVRKEPEDYGVTIEMFNANKDFICEWIIRVIAAGAFVDCEPDRDEDAQPLMLPAVQ